MPTRQDKIKASVSEQVLIQGSLSNYLLPPTLTIKKADECSLLYKVPVGGGTDIQDKCKKDGLRKIHKIHPVLLSGHGE